MREVVPDVYVMEGVLGSNVYALASDSGVTLVDTGVGGQADRILAQLQARGYSPSDLKAIVLTHCHGDHAGSAAQLARRCGAQVLAHQDEVPYIERTSPLPTDSAVKRFMNWLGDAILLRRDACHIDRPLQDGDAIEALGGMRAVHAPGHSPGSLCLYQPERRILFCGDALFNAHPITGKRGLGLHMRLFTWDNALARDTARRLSTLAVQVLCCGHGQPILAGAGEQMRALVGDRGQ
ncbi:MAG: MBL fold metallo-hydrolase [Anaerolineae bacterium]|nr:MBL fold metallo-hydrolase [Anaerolineae bacterium]